MNIKLKIPYHGKHLKVFIYNIPAWLIGGLVIVALILLSLKIYPFHP